MTTRRAKFGATILPSTIPFHQQTPDILTQPPLQQTKMPSIGDLMKQHLKKPKTKRKTQQKSPAPAPAPLPSSSAIVSNAETIKAPPLSIKKQTAKQKNVKYENASENDGE